MRITKLDDLQIGYWVTQCCHIDLVQITNDGELRSWRDQVIGYLEDEADDAPTVVVEYWHSERDALLEIRKRFSHPDDQAEINARLEALG